MNKKNSGIKAIFVCLALSVCSLSLTSCFEISQSISLKDGKYTLSYSNVMPASLLDLISYVGASQGQDVGDLITALTEEFNTPEYLPSTTVTTAEVTASDIVYLSTCTFSAANPSAEEKMFVPVNDGKFVAVPLAIGEEELSDAASGLFMLQYAAAMMDPSDPNYENYIVGFAAINSMLDGLKLKVYVDKSICPSAKRAYLPYYDNDSDGKDVLLMDLGSVYQVHIPFSYLLDLDSSTDNTLVVLEM